MQRSAARMTPVEIMSEGHESARVYSIITGEQCWETDSFTVPRCVKNVCLT